METDLRFRTPKKLGCQQLEHLLVERYLYKLDRPAVDQIAIYDTYDWRLFNNALTLHRSGQGLVLRSLENASPQEGVLAAVEPNFAWDLPQSALRDRLERIVKVRALLKLAEVEMRSTQFNILNEDEKTVGRLLYKEYALVQNGGQTALRSHIELLPIRGYPKYERQLVKLLKKAGCKAIQGDELTPMALEAAGKRPGSYSSKLNYRLKRKQRADEASKVILRQMLAIMRANEAGIKADIDTEFLHDYRIAVRRTRSLLSQNRRVFAAETTERFKRDFRVLGKRTNELRDLDVYLLSEGKFEAALPDELQEDIKPLFNYLKERRQTAIADVVEALESQTYTRIILDWQTFLTEPSAEKKEAANAALPIVDLARKRIYKRYRRVIKDGTYILDHTQDELLHDLRIECKKLRYLLEFYAPIFPRKKITKLIKQLKRLQDNLGEFSDLSVQQEYLMHIAEELPIDKVQARRALVATGYLVESMGRRQQEVKADFAKTFTKFASPANERLFCELFTCGKKKGKR